MIVFSPGNIFSKTEPYIETTEVLTHIRSAKSTLWIGTADIKDLYVEMGKQEIPFLGLLVKLVKKGVSVRLIHAKEPGPAFREDFDKYPELFDGLERGLCPRVHFKMIIFDCRMVYIASANLTGEGMGMKSENNRNFEAGILTDDPAIVVQAMDQFDCVWNRSMCKKCRRKQYSADPISNI